MAAYTEETSDRLSKREIIGIALSLKNKIEVNNIANTYALEEIRKFNKNFVKLQSAFNVIKNVNKLLN